MAISRGVSELWAALEASLHRHLPHTVAVALSSQAKTMRSKCFRLYRSNVLQIALWIVKDKLAALLHQPFQSKIC